MSIAQSLLPEFDQEMAKTRSILEVVPTDRNDWQPHEKSMTIERLALHLANLPSWAGMTLSVDEFDMNHSTTPANLVTIKNIDCA